MTEVKDVRAMMDALLQNTDDLDQVVRMVAREQSIRATMAQTGEGREVVVEAVDAMESMDREAVTELTDGQPTTLRAALIDYVAELERRDHLQPRDRIIDELGTILGYPWSGEEERLALHGANRSLGLHVERTDERNLEIRIGSNRWLLTEVNWEEAGSGGIMAAEEVAEAVYRAVLVRVIADREHIVQLNAAQTADLRAWLDRPNGSLGDGRRLTVDAVAGGGVLVRTRPYSYEHEAATARRRLESR